MINRKYLALAGIFAWFLYANYADTKIKSINGRYEFKNDVPKELITLNQQNRKTLSFQMNHYVSIAQLSNEYFVMADYANLFLLNKKTNRQCVLKPFGLQDYKDVSSLPDLSKVYVPTGVFIDQKGVLFVANYTVNNILEGSVDTQKCEVHFKREFASENTKGPENVSVDASKNILVSANYDAGTVTAFNLKSGKELWSTPIGQAHGVAISGNKVFATGLTERKIYELNLDSGQIVNAIGSVGWDPMKSQFLWPTSIYPYDKDKLIISDAQTGYISFLDKKSLQTIKYTGGNGPSYRWFNYPYAAYPTNKNIIILSSLRGNILFLDYLGAKVLKNLISVKDTWPKVNYSKNAFGQGWNSYININGPLLTLRDQQYRLGFGHLHPLDSGPTLRVPNVSTLYNLDQYMYFLQGYYAKGVNFIFSSSSTTLLAVTHASKKPDILLSNKIRLDSWLYNKDIINVDSKKTTKSRLIKENGIRAKKIYSLLDKNSWINAKSLYQLNGFSDQTRRLDYKEFVEYLDEVFQSPIGREFKYNYDQCSETHCNIKKLKQSAKKYYFEAQGYSYLNLDEYLLVGMLSGTPVEKNQLLDGGDLNRLQDRTMQSTFEGGPINSKSHILTLADTISRKLHYGVGVSNIELDTINCTQKEIMKRILSSKTAHCGNYAYIFISSISPLNNWIVYDLKTLDGRIHSVVEVIKDNITQTVDPTLGVLYPCSVAQLINGSCNYSSAEYLTPPNQALNIYFGVRFFYGAKVSQCYKNMEKLTHTYCHLED